MMFCYPLMLHIQYYFLFIRLALRNDWSAVVRHSHHPSPLPSLSRAQSHRLHSTVSVAAVLDPSIVEAFHRKVPPTWRFYWSGMDVIATNIPSSSLCSGHDVLGRIFH